MAPSSTSRGRNQLLGHLVVLGSTALQVPGGPLIGGQNGNGQFPVPTSTGGARGKGVVDLSEQNPSQSQVREACRGWSRAEHAGA